MASDKNIVIVGAGLAGLTAAKLLKQANKKVTVLEASNQIGGKLKTDFINGFTLDYGFQVLLTNYPETKQILNYKALNLQTFVAGAYLFGANQKLHLIADPLRHPEALLSTLFSSSNNFKDKFLTLKLANSLKGKSLDSIFSQSEKTTGNYLKNYGFSERFISLFFHPFFTGIFLENKLETSSNMFEFVLKMFAEGNAAIPAKGMQAIPYQLAQSLTSDEVLLNSPVKSIEGGNVVLANGSTINADFIIDASNTLTVKKDNLPRPKTANYYFETSNSPFEKGAIALNGNAKRLVNNLVVLDKVAPSYAPNGKHLVSVSLVGDAIKNENQSTEILAELKPYFNGVDSWKYLKHYNVQKALPNQNSVKDDFKVIRTNTNLISIGHEFLNGSINAAVKSGRVAAEALLG